MCRSLANAMEGYSADGLNGTTTSWAEPASSGARVRNGTWGAALPGVRLMTVKPKYGSTKAASSSLHPAPVSLSHLRLEQRWCALSNNTLPHFSSQFCEQLHHAVWYTGRFKEDGRRMDLPDKILLKYPFSAAKWFGFKCKSFGQNLLSPLYSFHSPRGMRCEVFQLMWIWVCFKWKIFSTNNL